jgi:lysozyme
MDPANLQQLVEELRFDEGVRYWPYADTNGARTVGVGHNLTASPLPEGWDYPLTDEQVDELLQLDLQTVFTDLDSALPWWNLLSDVRQRVIANMCFNLGITKLLGFRSTLTAMRQGRYSDAATGMLNSAWASQVGARATRLANMMLTGVTQ